MQMLRVMISLILVTQILCYKYFPANLFHALPTSLELVLVMLMEHLDNYELVCYIGKNWLVLVDFFCLLQNKKVVVCTSLPFHTCVQCVLFPFSHLTFQWEEGLLGQLLKIYNIFLLYSHPLFFFNHLIKESSILSIKFSFAVLFLTGCFFFIDFT